MRAAGRCAVITGAASGLGAAAAHRLAAEGARVVIADLDGERAMTMARQIDPGGRQVVGLACDIARDEDNERMVREAPEQYLWVHKRFKTRPDGAKPVY